LILIFIFIFVICITYLLKKLKKSLSNKTFDKLFIPLKYLEKCFE